MFRRFGEVYLRDHVLVPAQARVLRAVMVCRTPVLGGHADVCPTCGHVEVSYDSCRDRHCPTCQGSDAARWVQSRLDRVLPVHHFHVVFTLPEGLRSVALANPALVYGLLFDAASATLQELGQSRLDARLGITAVLHTWTRQMEFHPHLHTIVTGGGLSLDGERWVACRERFLFPVRVMSDLFRGKFLAALQRAWKAGKLHFAGTSAHLAEPGAFAELRDRLYRVRWVVYAKRPFGGPEQVIRYLGRYTHRVAISSSRLVEVGDDRVVFRTRGQRLCRLRPEEFVRRFLLHVLPKSFRKIRHYGLLAPANVNTLLATAQRLLGVVVEPGASARAGERPVHDPDEPRICPACGQPGLVRLLIPAQPRAPPVVV